MNLFKRISHWIAVCARTDLSANAKLLFGILLLWHQNGKTGRCFPSRGLLASETGMSVATVRRALSELKVAAFLAWETGHWGAANAYSFPRLEGAEEAQKEVASAAPPVGQLCTTEGHASSGSTVTPSVGQIGLSSGSTLTHQPLTRKEPIRESKRFEEFWSTYPESSERAYPQKPASEEFGELSELEQQTAIQAARRYGARTQAAFVKDPAKWLRNEEWKTEPLAKPPLPASGRMTYDQAVQHFLTVGLWSRQAPCSDISQVPKEILDKYDLLPDGRKKTATAVRRGNGSKPIHVSSPPTASWAASAQSSFPN